MHHINIDLHRDLGTFLKQDKIYYFHFPRIFSMELCTSRRIGCYTSCCGIVVWNSFESFLLQVGTAPISG